MHSISKAIQQFQFRGGIEWDLLSETDYAWLEKNAVSVLLPRKQVLFRQGTAPRGVYVITKGKVKAYQTNPDGSVQILFIYTAGDTFGYRPLLSDEHQPISVAAIEDCELKFINKIAFLDLIATSVTLSNQLLISLSREFSILINRINIFTQKATEVRLAIALLLLNEKFKQTDEDTELAEIRISRSDLADYVGTSLETLIRTLTKFRKDRLITLHGKSLRIENPEGLFQIASL